MVSSVAALCGCKFDPDPSPNVGGGDAPTAVDGVDGVVGSCGAPASFDAGVTPTMTIYVSPMGSPAPDGSAASPFGSITAALVDRSPGTRIALLPGTYPGELITDLHGTATAPFWIEGPTTGVRRAVQLDVAVRGSAVRGGSTPRRLMWGPARSRSTITATNRPVSRTTSWWRTWR